MGHAGRPALWKLLGVACVVALAIAFCFAPIAEYRDWHRLDAEMRSSLKDLRPTDPSVVDAPTWDACQGAVWTAYGNVCASGSLVGNAEMARLRDDLDRKLKGKVDLDTLVWIWERLGQTGPSGKSYALRLRPILDQYMPAAR